MDPVVLALGGCPLFHLFWLSLLHNQTPQNLVADNNSFFILLPNLQFGQDSRVTALLCARGRQLRWLEEG